LEERNSMEGEDIKNERKREGKGEERRRGGEEETKQ
jgi:hypothetical protein